jgi:pimeloyl-ACP methyl ester carboxylesterase
MFTPATPAAVQQHVLKMMLAPPEATATGAMQATFDTASWGDDVMPAPVLGIYAGNSRLANQDYAKKVFPHYEFVEVPGTGHFVMMERPEEFNHLVIAFMDKATF